jgi:hypothetical protein
MREDFRVIKIKSDWAKFVANEKKMSRTVKARTIKSFLGRTKTRYLTGIPRKPLSKGRVLVHNPVIPQPYLGMNGFRAWTQLLADNLKLCRCDWAGVDLHGLKHYHVKRKGLRRKN